MTVDLTLGPRPEEPGPRSVVKPPTPQMFSHSSMPTPR